MTSRTKAEETQAPSPPSASLLVKIEKATLDGAGKLLGIAEKPIGSRLVKLDAKQLERLREIEEHAIANFQGDLTVLESALGMLRMGHQFGWRVLYLIHSKRTIRNYEEVLAIRIREEFDETGPSSYRSIGLNLADRFTNFWKVVAGEIKIPRRKDSIA
jgi:hypothetical protein